MLSALGGLRIARETTLVLPPAAPAPLPTATGAAFEAGGIPGRGETLPQLIPGGGAPMPPGAGAVAAGAATKAGKQVAGGRQARPADSVLVPSFLLGGEEDDDATTGGEVMSAPLFLSLLPGGAAGGGITTAHDAQANGSLAPHPPPPGPRQPLQPVAGDGDNALLHGGNESSTIGMGEDDEDGGEGLVESVFGGLLRSDVTCLVSCAMYAVPCMCAMGEEAMDGNGIASQA